MINAGGFLSSRLEMGSRKLMFLNIFINYGLIILSQHYCRQMKSCFLLYRLLHY